jgi:Leucine-rich repeat (LRR) protein
MHRMSLDGFGFVLLWVCALIKWIVLSSTTTAAACTGGISDGEYMALQDLYTYTSGENWVWIPSLTTKWHFPVALTVPCTDGWQGLTCVGNIAGCSIQILNLEDRGLSGPLVSSLQNLTGLTTLIFNDNNITGTLPPEIGNMQALKYVYLYGNQIFGPIPSELGLLAPTLIVLSVYSNYLTHTLPVELCNLYGLSSLFLDKNLLSGSLSSSLGDLVNLRLLEVNNNILTGAIPETIGNFGNLTLLSMQYNFLSDSIPSEIGQLESLVELFLYSNELVGPIPFQLGDIEVLELLYLYTNHLSSSIPAELGKLENLQVLELGDNCLVGHIPSELQTMAALFSLALSNNLLTGTVPSSIGNIVKMQALYLEFNFISGTIPASLGNLQLLECLFSYNTYLSGSLPTQLGMLASMEIFYVYDTFLTGLIPTQFGSMTSLEVLGVYYCILTGSIPSELAALPNIQQIGINDNYLEDSLPSQLGSMGQLLSLTIQNNLLSGIVLQLPKNIQNVDVSNNLLFGSLRFLENCTLLQSVNVGNNEFTGGLPRFASTWENMRALNMSSNFLAGHIDPVFNDTSSALLRLLDISNNKFSGTLSASLFELPSLQTVILSQNCFSGSLPTTLCGNSNLEYIVLDLLTANCGNAVASIPLLQGFVLRRLVDGSIPSCIWNMSSIKLLHLIGNGLMGSLADYSLSSNLSVLALGSNQLSGTVPLPFQTNSFTQLDLSINRLFGGLSNILSVDTTTTAVYSLSVNRLSGEIPSVLFSSFATGVLDVLQGNLFGCKQSNIPTSDAHHSSYQCGSIEFEYSLLVWITGLSVCCIPMLIWIFRGIAMNELHFVIKRFLLGPACLVGLCLVALVGYLSFKLSGVDNQRGYITHTSQYWWVTTVVFLHGGATTLFVFLLLGLLSFAMPYFLLRMRSVDRDPSAFQISVVGGARVVIAHSLNIAVVVAVNAAYITLAANKLTGVKLLVVQAVVGLFKILWSAFAIPLLISLADAADRPVHRIFMAIFIYVGAPFISTFCESSYCFLYILARPGNINYSFDVPQMDCFSTCTSVCEPQSCAMYCDFACEFGDMAPYSGSIIPPWMYSYQCSSAIITTYAPVLILSSIIYSVLSLLFMILFSKFHKHVPQSWRKGHVLLLTVIAQNDTEVAASLIRSQPRVLGEFSRSIMTKFILTMAVIGTFGLAIPLLALATFLEAITYFSLKYWTVEKFVVVCGNGGVESDQVRNEFSNSMTLSLRQCRVYCFVLMGFIGVFWSLFAFDMIGDVYGPFAGALTILVPLLLPMLTTAYMLGPVHQLINVDSDMDIQDDLKQQNILSNNANAHSVVQNPIISPQRTDSNFEL